MYLVFAVRLICILQSFELGIIIIPKFCVLSKGVLMNNKVRIFAVTAMLLCSVALIVVGISGDFGKFGNKQILATLAPTQAEYKANLKKTVTTSEKLTEKVSAASNIDEERVIYVLNIKSKVFHHPWCGYADRIDEENRDTVNATKNEMLQNGYKSCGRCEP